MAVGSQVMHMLSVMIVGLAMGTTLSQAVSVAVSLLVIVKRNTGISLTKADLRPDRAVMGRLLKIGIPIALQDGFIQVSFMVITIIANRRGLTDAAAVGIVEKMIGFLFLVPSSMLSTVSALGGPEHRRRKAGAGQGHPGLRYCHHPGLHQPDRHSGGVSGGAHGGAVYAG